jgi:hypothetical protein
MLFSLSTSTNIRIVCYFDNGASRYMTWTHDLFTKWLKTESDLHVEIGTHAKCGAEGFGTIRVQLESGGSLEA